MADLDSERQEQAKDYARMMRRISFLELGLTAFIVLVLLITPLSTGLRNMLDLPQPLRVALFITTLMICLGVISAPLSFYGGFVVPRRFGLLHQRLRDWLLDGVKAGVLGLFLGVGIIVFVYWLLESCADLWWIIAAAFLILLTIIMTNLAPIIIVPLFYKMQPLNDVNLVDRLRRLAEKARTRIHGVYTINLSSKTTTGNAALMGLGNTRRIVLGDNLLERYSTEEIEVIVAHELGHHVHRDMARLMVFQTAIILTGFYLAHLVLKVSAPYFNFDGISDIAAFPLLVVVVGGFTLIMQPLISSYIRHLEGIADEYALTLSNNPQ